MTYIRFTTLKTYLVTFSIADGKAIGGRLMATFSEGKLKDVAGVKTSYAGLKGRGTEDEPYVISGRDDFISFLIQLIEDRYHGKGLFSVRMPISPIPMHRTSRQEISTGGFRRLISRGPTMATGRR